MEITRKPPTVNPIEAFTHRDEDGDALHGRVSNEQGFGPRLYFKIHSPRHGEVMFSNHKQVDELIATLKEISDHMSGRDRLGIGSRG